RPVRWLPDARCGGPEGGGFLPQLRAAPPAMDVVLVPAHGSIDSAVTAMKRGAYDYLTKPPDLHRLRVILSHLEEKQVLNEQIKRLEQLVGASESLARLWGESDAIRQVRELIATVGPTDATVLILGESGTRTQL